MLLSVFVILVVFKSDFFESFLCMLCKIFGFSGIVASVTKTLDVILD